MFWFRKKARVDDLLRRSFGEGPDGPSWIAGSEFVRTFRSVRFTCRGLDYEVWKDIPSYGFGVQLGRTDKPGRPADGDVLVPKTLAEVQAYNAHLFYWEDIQVALGDPALSRDTHHLELGQLIATLKSLEPELRGLFLGDAYPSLNTIQAQRVETQETERRRSGHPQPDNVR